MMAFNCKFEFPGFIFTISIGINTAQQNNKDEASNRKWENLLSNLESLNLPRASKVKVGIFGYEITMEGKLIKSLTWLKVL